MELPSIGQHCSVSNCNQLDFLPFICKCGEMFCSEHFSDHSLNCNVLEMHAQVFLDKDTKATYTCSKENCNERSYVPLICSMCSKHFCLLHRHVECSDLDSLARAKELEKFNVPARDFKEAKLKVDKELSLIINEARKKPKTAKMANKIQLMQIKGKATGLKTIPTNDRVYFKVQTSMKKNQLLPVFISRTWSLGKAIDSVANELNLINRNNQTAALKLRLFHKDTGQVLSTNLSTRIDSLISEEALLDGEDLILEYVENDCFLLNLI